MAESDAVRAYLGEFVSGRLLNVYEPLLNADVSCRLATRLWQRISSLPRVSELLLTLSEL